MLVTAISEAFFALSSGVSAFTAFVQYLPLARPSFLEILQGSILILYAQILHKGVRELPTDIGM